MHLATEQLSSPPYSRTLPTVLPAALVPPSLRPPPPDPTMFEESRRLISELEAINRERTEVEASHTVLTIDAQRRATEAACIQRKLDALTHTSRSLMNQRTEAERRLAEYLHERDNLQSVLNELKSHILNERQAVEAIRTKVDDQQASAKTQEDSLEKLRCELNELIREEAALTDRLSLNRRRLQLIETENDATQSRVEKATKRVESLNSTKGQLLRVLDEYTNLLNGNDSTTRVPDMGKVSALLNDYGTNAGDFKNKLSMEAFNVVGKSGATFGDLDWTNSARTRGPGASSVPLSVMSSNRIDVSDNHFFLQPKPNSSLGMPICEDPFQETDPFKTVGTGGHIESSSQVPADDIFGHTSLFSTSDPFKGMDPFGSDPFVVPTAQTAQPAADIVSAFDPFSPVDNPVPSVQNTFTNADFDAVFGPPTATPANAIDPFAGDPFSSVEQQALSVSNSAAAASTASTKSTVKHTPPPRPKTQPGAGKLRKSTGSAPRLGIGIGASHSIGSLPNMSTSPTSKPNGSPLNVHQQPNSAKSTLISRVRSTSKSKKDGDGLFHRIGNTTRSGNKPSNPQNWVPQDLSEAEQMSLATLESQRLAQLDEQARLKEEADIRLAIHLSKLDAGSA